SLIGALRWLSGVCSSRRRVTIRLTDSLINQFTGTFGVELAECATLTRESREQWRRFPPRAELAMELGDAVMDAAQPDAIGVEHRTAAPAGKAVAVHVHDVDVRRAQGAAI